MKFSPHLQFDGQCRSAFNFYHQILGGNLAMLTYGDSPMADQVESEWKDRIVHATLQVGQFELAGADVPPRDYRRPQGFSVLLAVTDANKAERIFSSLAIGGEVLFPFQKTFWSSGFGVLRDQFSIPWEVNSDLPPPN